MSLNTQKRTSVSLRSPMSTGSTFNLGEARFSQSTAITRSRNMTESKLKAQQALAKLADEEASYYSANLEESHHRLRTQLIEQSAVEIRQVAEAQDVRTSWDRKEQLNKLVDKITAIKSLLRFQEEARDADKAFKSVIRQKRVAFQMRLTRLEQRQASERNELLQSQQRLADTINQIRAIELKAVTDKNKARRMLRDYEIQSQQVSMRQQKESEFLREIQLCKARQMAELNDLDISNMEEYEEILIQQRIDEYELVAKQSVIEAEMHMNLERQKIKLEAAQLLEKQSSVKMAIQRAQRKQASSLAKNQRAAARTREKMLIGDHPVIQGETPNEEFEVVEEQSDSQSVGESEAMKNSNPSIQDQDEENEEKEKSETVKNSTFNRDMAITESEKEMQALIESGSERIHSTLLHHKKTIAELKQQHKFVLNQKFKELRKRGSELRKDHEEEIEQIKLDQAAAMKELLETHLQSDEMRADTAVSQSLLGMMLPPHIMEKIEVGIVPEPESFNCVTIFFTDIFDFKKLVGSVDPVNIIKLLNALYTQFDAIIAKYSKLYTVETVSDTYMVAAGISSQGDTPKEQIAECAYQALQCSLDLQKLVESMDFKDIVGSHPIKLRIGVHSGMINAGLIGTKMSRYCLFGDTVNTASRMCTTGTASRIQVSPATIQMLGADDTFEFQIRGEIEVKGKGKMRTYWLVK
ncbi:adenylate and guanylate cyclase catalytic domain-containing protein [Chytriomyces sp. MP71]|nr:adenylate and guanylate cyclase catalytic domain-containing protein [Chytriomyces sp. MP71]